MDVKIGENAEAGTESYVIDGKNETDIDDIYCYGNTLYSNSEALAAFRIDVSDDFKSLKYGIYSFERK